MFATVSRSDALKHILDVAAFRHRVIAQNIANLNTPFYQRLEVAFEDSSNGYGASGDKPVAIVSNEAGEVRADGNNVSIEQEMGDLSKNTLLFNLTAQLLASRISASRAAIAGR
jgi:flagellar basal-body rod protein FlgB